MAKPSTDIHIHHVPARFVRFVESASAYGTKLDAPRGEDVRLTIGSLSYGLNRTFFDIDRLIRRMAEMRVDRAVLSVATPFVRFDVPTSLVVEAAQTYNDEISAVRKAAPDRFEAWAYLPILDPELAARELSRAVKSLGLIGGYLPSNVNGSYLDANELSPVFRTAAELDVPLFVHPSNPPARERMNRYELPVVAGYLFDTTINIFQMIFGGLFDRHPTLRLCCTHLGGYAPLLQGRMQRELDTNPDLASRLKQPLGSYLRMIHYDTICFEPSYLRAAIESKAVDPKRLLLGSDTPFPLGEPDPVGFIERTFSQVGDSFADSIMRDNPAALLKSSGDRML